MRRVVVEQKQLLGAGIARHVNRVQPGAVAPALVRFVFFRCVLSIADKHIGSLRIIPQGRVEYRMTVLIICGIDDYSVADFNPVSGRVLRMKKALRFAMTLSDEVRALHVDFGDETDFLEKQWEEFLAAPAREAGRRAPELIIVKSRYRFVVGPIVRYVADLEPDFSDRQIAVIISELVERRWYHYLLHNQRAHVLTALLA